MKILGISAFYHDSAAALIDHKQILCAAQEERFSRVKHDSSFPTQAISYCLKESGLSIDQLDAVVFYDKPFLKFERLLETYYGFSPKGVSSFIKSMPVWINQKLIMKRNIRKGLADIQDYDKKKFRLLFSEHHLSHAASAFYPSPFEEAAILTIDGVGEWATTSISHGKGKDIKVLRELHFPHSLGLLYSAFTYYLGFRVNSGEYKLMGLAPYGNSNSENTKRFEKIIREKLIRIKPDGSLWLDQNYFNYAVGIRMAKDKKWKSLFGFPRRSPEAELRQIHCDLAWAIQHITEEIIVKMAQEAKRLTGAPNLCLAGGVALNCVANGKIEKKGLFEKIFIQPAAGDAGGALGAAFSVKYLYFNQERHVNLADSMAGAFLGPHFESSAIEQMTRKNKASYQHFDNFQKLCATTADLLNDGHIIGWFQGRMEFGPRALGARSILGDPRNPEMQQKLNLKIKYRESFRPFAPAVLAESASNYFDLNDESPYMSFVHPIIKTQREEVPNEYWSSPMRNKLDFRKSKFPAVTHADFSARIQTVSKEVNPRFHQLIKTFEEKTGCGMVVNTSFNVRGEPIVCTPEDAYLCFMRTEMNYLIIGDYLFDKKNQSNWENDVDWKETFTLD